MHQLAVCKRCGIMVTKILLVAGVLCLSVMWGAKGAKNDELGSAQDGTCSGAPTSKHQTYRDTKYEHVWWDELPEEAREAVAALGYDEYTWNTGELPSSIDVVWEDLSEVQVAAAATLGWDPSFWNQRYEKMKWMTCKEWERIYKWKTIERFNTHYQDIEILYSKEEDDACLTLDDYLHT